MKKLAATLGTAFVLVLTSMAVAAPANAATQTRTTNFTYNDGVQDFSCSQTATLTVGDITVVGRATVTCSGRGDLVTIGVNGTLRAGSGDLLEATNTCFTTSTCTGAATVPRVVSGTQYCFSGGIVSLDFTPFVPGSDVARFCTTA